MSNDDHVVINVNLEIPGRTLERIVHTAKTIKGPDGRGHFRIDTAELVSHLISRFLRDGGFAEYAAEGRNYHGLLPPADI
ncbi:MAG: hypothetical protein QNJ04_15320 [Desulfobacterales bacterium]|nr:hypothetical protein [Desulfobacterales bacterium]